MRSSTNTPRSSGSYRSAATGCARCADRPAHLLGARSAAPSKRELWDTTITEILSGVYEPDAKGKRPPESLYGSLKVWAHLQRQGIPVPAARRSSLVEVVYPGGARYATLPAVALGHGRCGHVVFRVAQLRVEQAVRSKWQTDA